MITKKRFAGVLNFILVLILAVASVPVLSGCTNITAGERYLVYYSNAEFDDIVHREYSITDYEAKDVYTKVTELLYQMFDVDYTDESCYSAKPSEVEINDFVVNSEGVLSVDFSSAYLDMTNVKEVILRSALALTVIQVEGISGVELTVEGYPITDSKGNEIGVINAASFVNVLLNEEGMLKQETDVTLYFANPDGTALVPIQSHFAISSNNASIEKYILDQLIAGPAAGLSAARTIVPDVELISVTTTDYVCYVNFGSSFLEQEQTVSDEIMIYSIVNSLCRLYYVHSVQFLINGDVAPLLHGVTDLSKPFSANRDLIERPAETETEIID